MSALTPASSADGAADVSVLLVDAANVVGSRPDGWWRDRAGAAAGLVARLVRWPGRVVVVLEGEARRGVAPGPVGRVEVRHAPGDGDDALVAACAPGTLLVTADRALAARARTTGAEVTGPKWLLERLDALDAGRLSGDAVRDAAGADEEDA